MKYQNNTSVGVVIPVKMPKLAHELANVAWVKFKPGEIKEVPERATETAEKHGLTKVEVEVKAMESSIGKTKVETKKKKKVK